MRKPLRFLVPVSLLVVVVAAGILMIPEGGCSSLFGVTLQFRITNATGKEVAVTSAHAQQVTRIASQARGIVEHAGGDITVKQKNGKTWVYKNVSRMDLEREPYRVFRSYPIPFGGGTSTVNLLLAKDGRLYVVPSGAKDVDVEKLRQLKGFPLTPEEVKRAEKTAEEPSGNEKDAGKERRGSERRQALELWEGFAGNV